VEGILGPPANPRPVTSATARFAFSYPGMVEFTGGQNYLRVDGLVFDDVYGAKELAQQVAGTKVYLRGIMPDDFDYNEPKDLHFVRESTAGPGYSAYGSLDLAEGTVTNFSDGTVVTLESTLATEGDPLLDGQFVYVAGDVVTNDPGAIKLVHNQLRPAFYLTGSLQIGFECAPLFVANTGGYFFVENTGTFQFYDCVTITGALSRTAAPCDFDALVDNMIEAAPPDACGGQGPPDR
jgi:hypothetical protein